MKKILSTVLILISVCLFPSKKSTAQTIEILAGNTVNGAMTGTLLGGAAMALDNNTDFAPLRVGLGLGILGGVGAGVYDVTYGKGNEILVSGLFNDGENSSIIILLDTFYGIGAGSIIATSVMLVANEPLLDGLQYGAAVGAIAGFGFGVFDSFVLAERISAGSATVSAPSDIASGLIGVSFNNGKSLGFLSPSLINTFDFSAGQLQTTLKPTVEIINLRLNF
ncbi:MAG: hypothetical protein FH748_11210 [Balneolaceae bacterium]|nr:hypothetical protein [Balneolaceae bacterium]